MSVRGIASGVAGSAAVAVVAALSLGMTRAAAHPQTAPDDHARVTPAVQPITQPISARPAWLRRLLSPTDLAMEALRRRS